MNKPNKGLEQGSQKVVFDQILSRIPGGVHVKNDSTFESRSTDKALPAGTAIEKDGDDFKVVKKPKEGTPDFKKCIGLTEYDIEADDFPLVSIVDDARVRVEALPDVEKDGFDDLKKVITGLKPY